MTHLNDAELVDLIEDATQLPAGSRQHAESCLTCRSQSEALRTTLAEAVLDSPPEPSPPYWDHFATRVSAAIRDEGPGFAAPRVFRRPVVTWAVAASVGLFVVMLGVWRATLDAPPPTGAAVNRTTEAPLAAGNRGLDVPGPMNDSDDIETDETWAVVRTAAEDLAWEDAHAVGISAHPGSAEGIALELTPEERTELARLLDSELKRSGA
jgi:hypothetical protein